MRASPPNEGTLRKDRKVAQQTHFCEKILNNIKTRIPVPKLARKGGRSESRGPNASHDGDAEAAYGTADTSSPFVTSVVTSGQVSPKGDQSPTELRMRHTHNGCDTE